MTSRELLLAQEVTASRPGDDGVPERVLQKTTLGVTSGEVLSVVGPSGSGKSTLLRLFNRLLEPDSGQITLSGMRYQVFPPVSFARSDSPGCPEALSFRRHCQRQSAGIGEIATGCSRRTSNHRR